MQKESFPTITFTKAAAAASSHTKIIATENLKRILKLLPVPYLNLLKEAGVKFRLEGSNRSGYSSFDDRLIGLNLGDFTGFKCNGEPLVIKSRSKLGWAYSAAFEEVIHSVASYLEFDGKDVWTKAAGSEIRNLTREARKLIRNSHDFFSKPLPPLRKGEKPTEFHEKIGLGNNRIYPKKQRKIEELLVEVILARDYLVKGRKLTADEAEYVVKYAFPRCYEACVFFETEVENRSKQIGKFGIGAYTSKPKTGKEGSITMY